jgi:hypothetical protein
VKIYQILFVSGKILNKNPINRKEMLERTARLSAQTSYDNQKKKFQVQQAQIRLNRAKLLQYSSYLNKRNKKLFRSNG